jgi:hypothetical protein
MTPSIWLERTDERVGLQGELIGQLAWWVDVGLRSKLRIEHGPLCLNLLRGSPTSHRGNVCL